MQLDPTLWGPPPTRWQILRAKLRMRLLKSGWHLLKEKRLNRLTVITDDGRVYEEYDVVVRVDVQDEGQTLKVWALKRKNDRFQGVSDESS